ncbi:cell wall metabolism sensor histidine kinase WalK [Salinibacillus xinjiangensis]|uniref:histidine kinase n=1 Tax=Salinibacillus xinjiangensis TaxID=1229268 RepID=A0A6G1XAP6_9BACI|nr:cell wall metabolism sensor histidine kinase WalK [Salinibacillus xinjiangensis]MRG87976.1 cell wall metabolism sensor histidine kinase WalK [Salinibacillus xinjiangensis]
MTNKVNFFKSVGLKIILVYILLLLIAIQLIGAYFASELEERLIENFEDSIDDRLSLLSYSLEQALSKERTKDDPTIQEDIQSILTDFDSQDITELQVIDKQMRIIGTTNQWNRDVVGKITTSSDVQRMFSFRTQYPHEIKYNRETGDRTLTNTIPIFKNQTDEIIGAIFFKASVEDVYGQLEYITKIFANGTILAITITALIGILVSRTITKPISEMRKQALVMAGGDFSKKVNVYGMDEIGQLAYSFNHLTDKLKESYSMIEDERRKLTSVLANMNEGVIACNRSGAIILMNEPAEQFIGKSFDELKGESIISILGMGEVIQSISDIQETGATIIDVSEDDTLLLRVTFSIIQDENEDMSGFITVLSDVTEEEKIERERREFVANVSHELRTPLTTMRSYLEALTDGDTWRNEDIAPKFLSVTQTETERMIRLVNDLLQLSKMDNKDNYLYKEKVDFIYFFNHIIDRFEMNKYEQNLEFVRKLPNNSHWVWMDKDKMTQVLDNVISNAIKYSPNGGVITLETEIKDRMLLTKVSDQGVGIPKEQVERIFDRFYRVDKARTRKLGGTGLGLAIAREMIEAHDGKIWAESKEGKGTTIYISLPMMHKKWGNAS